MDQNQHRHNHYFKDGDQKLLAHDKDQNEILQYSYDIVILGLQVKRHHRDRVKHIKAVQARLQNDESTMLLYSSQDEIILFSA